jgi:G3E family GTPase
MTSLFLSRDSGPFGRRQTRARGHRIPVTVLTGFLGAGKTTLLQRFLQTPEGAGTAVVVNEFGEAGIDDVLLRASADETVLLGNGCLCCVTRSDLQEKLRALAVQRERGEIPAFRRVVIETSGLADPTPILQTFATDRALGERFHLDVLLTVADAVNGRETLARAAEARKQAILADRLVISKSDIAGDDAAAALAAELKSLNPRAEIDVAANGALAPEKLTEPVSTLRNAFLAEAEHTDGIGSFVYADARPMPWPVFSRALEVLIALRAPDLLRVKGFLNVEDCQGPVLVQVVQHLSHPTVELQKWPDEQRSSRVVFITRGIAEKQVRDLIEAVWGLSTVVPAKAGTHAPQQN